MNIMTTRKRNYFSFIIFALSLFTLSFTLEARGSFAENKYIYSQQNELSLLNLKNSSNRDVNTKEPFSFLKEGLEPFFGRQSDNLSGKSINLSSSEYGTSHLGNSYNASSASLTLPVYFKSTPFQVTHTSAGASENINGLLTADSSVLREGGCAVSGQYCGGYTNWKYSGRKDTETSYSIYTEDAESSPKITLNVDLNMNACSLILVTPINYVTYRRDTGAIIGEGTSSIPSATNGTISVIDGEYTCSTSGASAFRGDRGATITGQITKKGVPLSGVPISRFGGNSFGDETKVTDSEGKYFFTNIKSNQYVGVTPARYGSFNGCSFDPPSKSFYNLPYPQSSPEIVNFNATCPRLLVTKVEPVQVIYEDQAPAEDSVVNLIANKPTAIRVTVEIDDIDQLPSGVTEIPIEVSLGGQKIDNQPIPISGHTKVGTTGVLTKIFTKPFIPNSPDPDNPGILTAYVPPSTLFPEINGNNKFTLKVVTQARKLNLQYIPVECVISSCGPIGSIESTVATSNEFINATFPIVPIKPEESVSSISITGSIDTTVPIIVTYEKGWTEGMVEDLTTLASIAEALNADKIFGVVSKEYFAAHNRPGILGGTYTNHRSALIVKNEDDISNDGSTAAHELGHMYGIEEEEYNTDPPNKSAAPGYWVDRSIPIIGGTENGSDRFCLMGSSPKDKSWIDREHYNHFLNEIPIILTPPTSNTFSKFDGENSAVDTKNSTSSAQQAQNSSGNFLVVSAVVGINGSLKPLTWKTTSLGIPTESKQTGNYNLKIFNTAGQTLSETKVPVEFVIHSEPGGAFPTNIAPFVVKVPYPINAASVQILKDNQPIGTFSVTGKLLRDTINAIPDSGFNGNAAQQRTDLLGIVTLIENNIASGNYQAAKQLLVTELKAKVQQWLRDGYPTETALQLTKSEVLSIIDGEIARLEFIISPPSCSYSLSASSINVPSSINTGTVSVTTTAECPWIAAPDDNWITITGRTSGAGNGTVSYSVAANTGAQRTGTITIAGKTFTITQFAEGVDCLSTTITPGQTVNGNLQTGDCKDSYNTFYDAYTFSGTAGQKIYVTMNSSQFDTYLYLIQGSIILTEDDDGGGGRNSRIPATSGFLTLPTTGTYTILANAYSEGETGSYTLSLGSTCTYSISPTSDNAEFNGKTGTVTVTAPSDCAWTAVSNVGWLTVSSGATGAGSGTVNYSVAANNSSQRIGIIMIAGQSFTVTQDAFADYTISGEVMYGNTPAGQASKFISGVNLTAGSSTASAVTDANGSYQLSDLTGGGNYTVTPTKSGDVNGINSTDALRIQQYIVGSVAFTPAQLAAADTSNNGAVNSTDALRIQQYIVQAPASHIVGQWKFLPSSKNYSSLNANLSGENYTAVLMGEVSGNWTPPASMTSAALSEDEEPELIKPDKNNQPAQFAVKQKYQFADSILSAQAGVTITLPTNATSSNGTNINIPIDVSQLPALTDGNWVETYNFNLQFNSNILSNPAANTTGTISAAAGGSLVTGTPQAGVFSVSYTNPNGITGAGTLLNIHFTVVGTSNQQTALTFVGTTTSPAPFEFNEGDPQAMTNTGQFKVMGTTAANVSIGGRVMTESGRGIRNVWVTLTDAGGNVRTATTTAFGYYRFADVAAGETYIITAFGKRYTFNQPSQVVNISGDLTDINFIGNSTFFSKQEK